MILDYDYSQYIEYNIAQDAFVILPKVYQTGGRGTILTHSNNY